MGIFDAAKDKIDDLRGEHGAEHEGFDAAKASEFADSDKIDDLRGEHGAEHDTNDDGFEIGSDAGDDLGQADGFGDEPVDSGFVKGHDGEF